MNPRNRTGAGAAHSSPNPPRGAARLFLPVGPAKDDGGASAANAPTQCITCLREGEALTTDGLCQRCANIGAWLDGMASWGSQELAQVARNRRDME